MATREVETASDTQDATDDPRLSNEFLTLGYVAMSIGSERALRLFNIYTHSEDCRTIDIHYFPEDGAYRRPTQDGSFSGALCYQRNERGAVVPQDIWQPLQPGDVQRHVDDAALLPPVFFIGTDHVVGINTAHVLDATNSRAPLAIYHPGAPAPLGNRTTTHLCLKWPGYKEYRKQVEIKNASRAPVTMSTLAGRIARFVERFIQEAYNQTVEGEWRVGPGYITTQNIYIVGLLHVSQGVWQPILQLDCFNTLP